jgi:serine/threonine-protein kinase
VTAGAVIDGVPGAGTQVRKNTQIDLLVSQGPAPAGAQSYIGLSSDQALNELTAAGYKVLSKYGYSDTIPAGSVITQSPPANTPLPKGSNITIVISSGSAKAEVPNVLKQSTKTATANLENAGFVVKVKSSGVRKSKVVVAISPKAGTKLKRGGTVTITVR